MIGFDRKWQKPPVDFEKIDCNAVHVWRACFQSNSLSKRNFVESLSGEEIERAQRYIYESDRVRYIFAHGILRSILSFYVGCAPCQLVFEKTPNGKPYIIEQGFKNNIQFNMSHSEDLTLIAVTRGDAVGIDVEYMRRVSDALQLVDSVFSVVEQNFLNSLPPADFDEGFFACWTSKEAYVKGIGKGISHPLDKFSILFSNLGLEGSIKVHDESVSANCWEIIRFSPGPGYSAALAKEKSRNKLRYFEYCISEW
jgi:4'-phosphopantetheinyl transferase